MLDEYKINRGVNRLPQISYIIPENSVAFRLDLQNYNVFTEISFTFLKSVLHLEQHQHYLTNYSFFPYKRQEGEKWDVMVIITYETQFGLSRLLVNIIN